MKTIPSVLLAGLLLCTGCLIGRPPGASSAAPGLYPSEPGKSSRPTQVTPRTESPSGSQPTEVNKPAAPAEQGDRAVPQEQVIPQNNDGWKETETRKPAENSQPAPGNPSIEEQESPLLIDPEPTDAPEWKPLEAPKASRNAPPLAREHEVQLGNAAPFPRAGSDRHNLSEVSRSEERVTGDLAAGWETFAQSSGSRPIQIIQSGIHPVSVVVIGSLYGNEPESVSLIEKLVAAPDMLAAQSVGLSIIRTANPDGLAEHIRTNQRGVDLNRNFPSTSFTAIPSQQTGPHPASEVETQALVKLLRSQSPARVVHVRSSIGSRPLVLVNSALKSNLPQQALPDYVDWGTFDGTFKAGSLEEFVTVRMSAEMMTILLPPAGFQGLTPKQFAEIILIGTGRSTSTPESLANGSPESLMEQALPASQAGSMVKPKSVTPVLEEVSRPGERGFVEFLPPPPDAKSSDPNDTRYYELPPPPEK